MTAREIHVPNLGDFKNVPVIEVFVKPGDTVNVEEPLVALESDKATMEIPSPSAGRVVAVLVKPGDKVSEGSAIVTLDASDATTPIAAATASATAAIRLPKYVRSFKSQKASTDVRVIFAVEASTTELSMLVLSA